MVLHWRTVLRVGVLVVIEGVVVLLGVGVLVVIEGVVVLLGVLEL